MQSARAWARMREERLRGRPGQRSGRGRAAAGRMGPPSLRGLRFRLLVPLGSSGGHRGFGGRARLTTARSRSEAREPGTWGREGGEVEKVRARPDACEERKEPERRRAIRRGWQEEDRLPPLSLGSAGPCRHRAALPAPAEMGAHPAAGREAVRMWHLRQCERMPGLHTQCVAWGDLTPQLQVFLTA